MHLGARRWTERVTASGHDAHIIDVGGRNINGTVRDLFPNAASYTAIDLADGPGVDVQADFLHYTPVDRGTPHTVDLILHLEVAEHTPDWPLHIEHAAQLLRPDGLLVLTAAGPDRLPHSGIDGGPLQAGEHYENLDPRTLRDVLDLYFTSSVVRTAPGEPAALRPGGQTGDVYALARR